MRFKLLAAASMIGLAALGCSDSTEPGTGLAGIDGGPSLAVTSVALSLTDVQATTGSSYRVVPEGMRVGAKLYTDRDYTAMAPLPDALEGLTYIQTANDDKSTRRSDGRLLSFSVNQPAIIYVAHDDKVADPAWLTSNFTSTSIDLISTDGEKKFSVFKRPVSAGIVTLGDNGDNPAGQSMYVVLVEPAGGSSGEESPQPGTLAITDVRSSSGRTYRLASGGIAKGSRLYTDRDYSVETLPSELAGLSHIQTPNDDKSADAADGTLVSFKVNQAAVVYVAHNDKIADPSWLTAEFEDTGLEIVTTDGGTRFSVFSREVGAGRVSLGDNGRNRAGQSMYFVLVGASDGGSVPPPDGETPDDSTDVPPPTGEDPDEPSPPATPRAGYHVSPSGSSGGDGSSSRPWDLATALTRTVAGGDTIWLHGGTYRGRFVSWLNGRSGAPIVVRQYPGERATIDGQLIVMGSYATFWGFEVMSSTSGPGDVEGVTVKGPGTRFINMVVHDHGGNGFGFWSEAPNSEIYGSLIYNNGRQRVIPNFAHGIYGQNATGTKRVVDNIVFNQFGYGLHFYADAGGLRNLHIEGNTVFQNGAPASRRGAPNLLIGGGTAAGGAQVLDNMIYATTNEGTNVWLGHGLVQQNDDVVLRGNYIVGGSPALRMRRWTQATVSNNTFVGYAELVNIFGGYQGYNWAANHHYRQTSAYAWTVNDITGTFSEWRSRTGLGSSDATTSGQPSGTRVVVRPNQYEPGRANVTIYNWSGQAGVSVDLSQVLTPGQRYEVRNAQNFFGTPVFSGTYAGGAVSFPMTGVTPPQPVGGWITAPPRTGPRFDAFVVLPK